MFRPNTVFVLGAGASCEAQMPSGVELKSRIAEALDFSAEHGGDPDIETCLREIASQSDDPRALDKLRYKAAKIKFGMPPAISIDNFLDAHRGDTELELVAKLAIARTILLAEAGGLMAPGLPGVFLDKKPLASTWYVRFFQLLTENVSRQEIKEAVRRVSVINFNYDRTLAYFLRWALLIYYDVDNDDVTNILEEMTTVHPYGRIADLDGEFPRSWLFGHTKYSSLALPAMASQIRTFGERIEEKTTLDAIKQLIANASTIVFMGFGFHRQNLALIDPGPHHVPKSIYASCLGISRSDRREITAELKGILEGLASTLDPCIEFFDGTCAGLLDEYRRTLTERDDVMDIHA